MKAMLNVENLALFSDEENLKKLTGRTTDDLDLKVDGRTDALYGEVYFHLPIGTPVYDQQPLPQYAQAMQLKQPPTAEHPAEPLPPAGSTQSDFFVGLRHLGGEGAPALRGDIVLTTYRLDGSIEGTPHHEGGGAEYALHTRAEHICNAYPENSRPIPGAVYELLRWGRVIGPDALSPADVPHWRKIRYEKGEGWVNLNAANVRKFSDADFPHWKGWRFVHDDTDGDSRCNSAQIVGLIVEVGLRGTSISSAIEAVSEEFQVKTSKTFNKLGAFIEFLWEENYAHREVLRWLGDPAVQTAIKKTVCKFPGEWNQDDIDKRWGWLKSHPEFGFENEDDWECFRKHVHALTVPAAKLPKVMREPHWHFHPQSFIEHFRQCGWLSEKEFVQMVPSHAVRTHTHNHRTEMLWEPVRVATGSKSIAVQHLIPLNRMLRKYGISTPLRQASFFGNALQETIWLASLSEGNGDAAWYAPWYGRGFLQLTNPDNYCKYWEWRGRTIDQHLKTALVDAYKKAHHHRDNMYLQDSNFAALTSQMIDWRADLNGSTAPAPSAEQQFAPSDSAGFYWSLMGMARYADEDHVLERHLIRTNHGNKVYYRSVAFWHASAAVNLPGRIHNTHYAGINGFDSRCCAYGTELAALTETRFPDAHGNVGCWFPEGYTRR